MSTTLSPYERDALVAQFDTMVESAPFQLLTSQMLQELGAIDSDGAPVVSLYLDLGPDARRDRTWATVLKNLTREAIERLDDRGDERLVAQEGKRLERLIGKTLPDLGRSVALFSSEPAGILREVSLPLPLPNRMVVSNRPYLRPLFREMDEHDRFLLVVIDDNRARLFVSQLGSIIEVADLIEEGPGRHKQGGWAQMRFQRHRDAHVLWHAGAVAHATTLAMDRFGARWLLAAGTPDVMADFRDQLPSAMADRLAGEFKVSATASVSEIAAAAAPVQRETEAREELATIEQMREQPAGSRAVWGLADTLRAVNEFRVMTLAVQDDYRAPGGICVDDQQLTHHTEGLCPVCGEPLAFEDDIVDAALERAHNQGARLELVRSQRARDAMEGLQPIGALLRY